jgi:hypothetical protein
MTIRAIVPNKDKKYFLTEQEGPVLRSPKMNELDD